MADVDRVQIEFGLEDKTLAKLVNVMPEITEKELLARIPGVSRMTDNRLPTDTQVFELQFQYGYGAGKQFLVMAPGEERLVPQKLAREIRPFLVDQGVVVVKPGEDETAARIRGLEDSLTWHRSNGSDRYTEMVIALGYNEEQEKRQRHNFKNYLINMTKEAVIQEEIDRLQKVTSEGEPRAERTLPKKA